MTRSIPLSLERLRCVSALASMFSKGLRRNLPSRISWLHQQNCLASLVGSDEGEETVGAKGTWSLVRGAHLERTTRLQRRAGFPIAADCRPLRRAPKVLMRLICPPFASRSGANEPAQIQDDAWRGTV